MDQSKKTMRHFYCRDVLWETFEQMANDFDCSIDYLVNEAMRYYARSKNYQQPGGGGPQPTGSGPQSEGPAPRNGAPNGTNNPVSYPGPTNKAPSNNSVRQQPGTQPPPQPNGPGNSVRPRPVPQPTPGYTNSPAPTQARGGGGGGGGGGGMHNQQVQQAPAPPPAPPVGGAGPTLFLVYNGQRYPVTKDQFIIGRGSKTSDLAIKDGNISRKHAAVIRRNGTFYIKDLGSTNGIDYKGMRIDNKRIDEGDVFHLCDYELRFTYRTD
jgi:hypothetical protein